MNRRRYVAIGLGSLFIWWGIQGGFIVGSVGALWFGAFTGGFLAAVGRARTGFDGVVESLVALAVVLVVGTVGLIAWAITRYGTEAVWLVGDAYAITLLAVTVRQQFLLPVILGGGTGGYLNRRYELP